MSFPRLDALVAPQGSVGANVPTLAEADAAAYPGPPIPYAWKMVAHMRAKDPAASLRVIASALGFSYQSLHLWVNKPKYQMYENWLVSKTAPQLPPQVEEERAAAAEKIKAKFESHAEEMQDRLLILLETSDDPRIQKEIAQDWLDRAGFAVPKGKVSSGMTLHMSEEMLETFFARAKEAGLATPVLDGEIVGDSHP